MKTKEQKAERAAYMKQYLLANPRAYLLHVRQNMLQRCTLVSNKEYHLYGARGIKVCKEWLESSQLFVDWAIASGWQRGLQIDRKDNNGNYEPDNCRWVTKKENARNRSNNKLDVNKVSEIRRLSAEGSSDMSLACMFGVDRALIYRIRKNQQWL